MEIPLNFHAFNDFIAWHPDHKGVFQSGLRTICSLHSFRLHANVMECLGGFSSPAVWSTLWKLKIPRKVHFFVWMILHGIIPLKSTLTNRHIGNDGACSICHQGLRMFGTYYLSVHKPGSCEIGS